MKNRTFLLSICLSWLAFTGFSAMFWHQFTPVSSNITSPTRTTNTHHPKKITHLSKLLGDIVPYDTLYAATSVCASEATVCLPGLPLDDVLKLQFKVNNTLYAGRFTGCDFDTIHQYVYQSLIANNYIGPYTLKSWVINGKTYSGTVQSIAALSETMNRWDTKGNWQFGTSGHSLEGGNQENTYGDMIFEYKNATNELVSVNLKPKYILKPKGTLMKLPTGFHKIVLTDQNTATKDSFYVRVACVTTERITRTLPLNGADTLCLNFSELTTKKIAAVRDIYANRKNNAATFKLIKNNTCIAMKAVQVGTDTAAYVVCDTHGICDTTIIISQVELKSRTRTLNIALKEGEEYKVCPDSSNIGNKIASFKSTCETNDAFSVAFKGNCATLKGIAASTITSACALIACNNNQCDTTKLLIKVTQKSATTGKSRTLDYTIPEGDELNWCLTDTVANNPLTSFTNACERDGNVFTKITLNTATRCVNVKGVRLGVGDKACIVACDKQGKCDTTYLILKVDKKSIVKPTTTKIETFTLIEGETKNWCLDTTKYTAAMLPLKSFVNSCPTSSGKLATPTLMAAKRCVAVKGNIVGTGEKICLVACTKTGVCDTTILNVTVQKKPVPTGSKIKIINQTVTKNKKGTYTIDTTALAGTKINSVRLEACKRKFGEFVSFALSPNERSVIYDGRDIGSDTACIFVKNDKEISDTTFLYVKVIENVVIKSTIKRDTVMVGKTKEYCIDTTKYGGAIDRTTFKNICAKSSGKRATIIPIPNRLCVSYKGITVGTDTACIVLCSKTAACDTTKLIITTIVNPNPPPVAASDSVVTKQDSAIVLKIANNDLVFGRTYSLKIIKPTLRGKAVVSGGNIEYVPDRGFCGAKDKLTYEICTTNGCDTASVVINVQCRSVNASGELKVNNGISPNGDGSNDVFTIEGLDKYPNNRVSIFNRWGASVFEKTNYQSDWGGTWNNTYLPDGTYFYILDDGSGKVLKKGYIQIQR